LAEIIKLTDSYRDMKINKVITAETARSVSSFFLEHTHDSTTATLNKYLAVHGESSMECISRLLQMEPIISSRWSWNVQAFVPRPSRLRQPAAGYQ
jgi:hypothetical protein